MTHFENQLQTVELNPTNNATHCIIWLHGLGADGHDFEPIAGELKLKPELCVRFVFPHAPQRAITLNHGMHMRGWYDIQSLELDDAEQDPEGVALSTKQVITLIEQEIENGIPAENIILAGFSQGCAIALFAGLTQGIKLGGVIALSGYLPILPENANRLDKSLQSLPIFMGHGKQDEVIDIQYAENSKSILEEAGFSPEWRTYDVAHGVTSEEINDISIWLNKIL